jgi:monofunctional biosynthetic peptidoglycan transglycosylase
VRREGDAAIPVADATNTRPRRRTGRLLGRLLLTLIVPLLLPVPIILLYRVVAPPVTPLMLIRAADIGSVRRQWVDYVRIAPALPRAVIAAEDARFCGHRGFDWVEIDKAYEAYRDGERLRGASTISQQLARNLFLWPGGGFVRKGAEAYITVLVETLLSKQRILELYLNVAEWGRGVFGAEVAAQVHFGRHAAQLTQREAALLAAVLPNPREWQPERPTAYLIERAETIAARMPEVAVPTTGGCR